MEMEFEGIGELKDELEQMRRKAEALEGEQEVPLDDLLTPRFLREHSEFSSLEEMFEKGGWEVETQEEFEALPDEEWDVFISDHSSFSTWEEMIQAAGEDWAARQLGLK